MKITKKITRQIKWMAEVTSYGLEWVKDMDPSENKSYRLGGIETVGHTLACMISQKVTHDSEPTSDVIVAMKLQDFPSRGLLTRYIRRYIRAYGPQ